MKGNPKEKPEKEKEHRKPRKKVREHERNPKKMKGELHPPVLGGRVRCGCRYCFTHSVAHSVACFQGTPKP